MQSLMVQREHLLCVPLKNIYNHEHTSDKPKLKEHFIEYLASTLQKCQDYEKQKKRDKLSQLKETNKI